MKKNLLLLICLCFSLISGFSQEMNAESFFERTENRNDDRSGIVIDASVSNVEVYVSGVYKGRTSLVLDDLVPGTYSVKLIKEGYLEKDIIVTAKQGYTNFYQVEMELSVGLLKLNNLFSDCEVYVDGNRFYVNPIECTSGSHEILVKRFGYDSIEKSVEIKAGKTIYLNLDFAVAEFKIEKQKVSKTKINPVYKNAMGKCVYSFEVAASGKVVFEIKNAEGIVVWSKNFEKFDKALQKITWDGRDKSDCFVADGEYIAVVKWEGGEKSFDSVYVDQTLEYPLFSYGYEGSGYGSAGCALAMNESYIVPYFGTAVDFVVQNNCNVKSIPVRFGVIAGNKKLGEASLLFTGFSSSGEQKTLLLVKASYKYIWTNLLKNKNHLVNGAVFVRYGYSSLALPQFYFGTEDNILFDSGAGLGTGVNLSYEKDALKSGLSVSYVGAYKTGNINDFLDGFVKSSVFVTCNFAKEIQLYTTVSLFNVNTLETDFGINYLPPFGNLVLNGELKALYDFNKSAHFSINFFLSYLM